MPVYIKHDNTWLRVKEVYAIKTQHGRKKNRGTTPYGIVAESVNSIKRSGYRYKLRMKVPFSKVSRFAIKAFLNLSSQENILVLIEEANDNYEAIVYAKTKKELEEAKKILTKILSELRTRKRKGSEEEEE